MPASGSFGPGFASTIRARIQWLVVACTVPMFLLAVLWLVLSYQRGREALLHANLQAARNVVQAVDREIDAAIQVLQALSTSASIDDRDYQRFHQRARQTLRYAGADNIVLFDTELNGLASAAHEWGTPLPKVREDRFPRVLSSGKPAVSDVFVGQVSARMQVAVAVPVLRDGRAVARLEMVFDLQRFADLLARQNFAPQWTAAVLDSQRVMVARSRDSQAFVGKVVTPELVDHLKRVREGSFEGYTADGSYVAATFSRASDHGWAVAIGVPVSELTAQLQRSLWQAGAATALLLVAGLLLARAIGRGIAAPIQALVQPALAIGRGEAAAVAPSALHEASELGRALQQAQQLLQQREQARQQAEASVRASQSRLQMALDSAQIGDWDVDLRSGAIRHSLQHDRCYGYTKAATDWSAERFFECVHPDDRERIRRHIQQTLRERTPWLDEYRVIWPDGSVHWLTTRGTFLSRPGEPGFVVGVVIDHTARRQAEELRLHSARLEAENRQIQEANRLKSEFLANMSHELRTPLNAVIGFADILRANGPHLPEEKRSDYLGHIAASGRHLLRLINDVLDLSKVESGKFDLLPEPVLLPQVADEVTAVLRSEAARKGVQLQMQIDPALTDLVLDPARLRQMIYNLLSNAIKFTGAGGRVVMRAMPQGEREMRIEVEDNGIGIAPADQPKLFRQFQQVHSGLAKTHPGTGLGLALTRHLAELHGGSVGVRSTPGVGSVFHLVLPRRLRAAARAGEAGEPPAPGAPTALMVEDGRSDQAELAQVLRAAGYQVEVAATAQQALQLAAARRYDAITLDLLLPDRGGLAVLNELRAGGINSEVPVVAITMATEASAWAGVVVADVLTKPLRQHEVSAALRRVRRSDGRAPRVLVVDDDPVALEQMAATLQTLGMTALLAPSGALAIEALERQAPDAMVLDLLMQGVNGFDLLHELRQRPRLEPLPVFVWTSMRPSADELATLSRSARSIVGKLGSGLQALAQQLRAQQSQLAQKEVV